MSRADAALDAVARVADSVGRHTRWMRRWYVPVTAAGLTAIAIVAVFRMEASVPNYDPQYMRVLVERTMATGGSYYSNGIHNKGPLEPLLYEIAGQLGGRDGWWFLIAVMALGAAVCVGLAAAVVAIRAGASTLLAVCVAVVAIVHLTLSSADYAGVLYARNMTTALLAVTIGVAAYDPWWSHERGRRVAVIAVGVASGLAVQTLLTTCFTATPVLLWAMWERRRARAWRRPAWLVMPLVAATALVTAPVYYLVVGPWGDFVDGAWTYARFMSTGTGRSLAGQWSLGWEQFLAYHGDRPEIVVVLLLWTLVTVVRFRSMTPRVRGLHVVVAAWWLGAWVELALGQRYSSHYFSILAVPTIMLIALAVGSLTPLVQPLLRARPAAALLPLLVAFVTIGVGGTSWFDVGVQTASEVRSTADFTERREVGIDGRTRMVRSTLDLVSEEGDPLLVWTSYPWPYLNLRRVSATRYIWKTFLLGEIYLGGSGPEYVLPGTWERFATDLRASDPTAYYVESVNPIDPGTPFRDAVDARFVDVFADDAVTLGLRRDLAAWIASPADDGERIPPLDDGPFTVSPDGCVRLDGTLRPTANAPLVVELVGPDGAETSLSAIVGGGQVLADSRPSGVAGWSRILETGDEPVTVSLIVGERSAVLVVDGQVAGAVDVAAAGPVVVTSGMEELTRAGARRSVPPALTGCVSAARAPDDRGAPR